MANSDGIHELQLEIVRLRGELQTQGAEIRAYADAQAREVSDKLKSQLWKLIPGLLVLLGILAYLGIDQTVTNLYGDEIKRNIKEANDNKDEIKGILAGLKQNQPKFASIQTGLIGVKDQHTKVAFDPPFSQEPLVLITPRSSEVNYIAYKVDDVKKDHFKFSVYRTDDPQSEILTGGAVLSWIAIPQ